MSEPVIIRDATLLAGDVREVLRGLEAGSVQCCITSPPYWGLRAYGTPPQVWGGRADCEHEWIAGVKKGQSGGKCVLPDAGKAMTEARYTPDSNHAFCQKCGAWRGELGQEPTPALFVEHLVEVFREVRRVLRPDGTLWLNMGDSYAGSMKGWSPSGPGYGGPKQRTNAGSMGLLPAKNVPGLKSKDLCEIPSDVVRALRADGWWLRSRIPWLKRNAMPESTTDRPTQAVEYVFLLTKSARYFYDGEASRLPHASSSESRAKYPASERKEGVTTPMDSVRWRGKTSDLHQGGRARRNSDWFFESWQGLYADDDGNPLAFIVNPAAFKAAHFATFPPKLVEPMVRVGTSERGCCPKCGKPWERMVERAPDCRTDATGKSAEADGGTVAARRMWERTRALRAEGGNHDNPIPPARTLGWRPGCECGGEPVPCTVLDPFSGAGTTCMVAAQLGRRAIGIDLKEEYNRMAATRIGKAMNPATFVDEDAEADLPLLAGVQETQGATADAKNPIKGDARE